MHFYGTLIVSIVVQTILYGASIEIILTKIAAISFLFTISILWVNFDRIMSVIHGAVTK